MYGWYIPNTKMFTMICKVTWKAIVNNKSLYREIYLLNRLRSNREGFNSSDIVVHMKTTWQTKQLSYGRLQMMERWREDGEERKRHNR